MHGPRTDPWGTPDGDTTPNNLWQWDWFKCRKITVKRFKYAELYQLLVGFDGIRLNSIYQSMKPQFYGKSCIIYINLFCISFNPF